MSTSNNPVLQPLLTLLPSYNPTTLPPRLLNLATSLLTQSRQRASHLKADEEIARPHACAEIAVDRLREALRLPPPKKGGGKKAGGPPCKPVVYKKLLGFLEGVLVVEGAGTPGSVRGGGRKRDVDAMDEDAEGEDDGEVGTPSKRARMQDAEAPTKSVRKTSGFVGRVKAHQNKNAEQREETPGFVMPAIRRLGKVYDTPAMAPHVYTGACVVLKEAQLWPPDPDDEVEEGFEGNVLALVTALYLMVLTKMGKGQMKTKVFNGVSKKAVELFRAKGLKKSEQISDWIKQINTKGWCKGQDWFESVPGDVFVFELKAGDAADAEEDFDDIDGDDDGEGQVTGASMRRAFDIDLDKDDPAGVLLPGLGTMMQASVDWTSDDRRRKYEQWKKGIMQSIEAPA